MGEVEKLGDGGKRGALDARDPAEVRPKHLINHSPIVAEPANDSCSRLQDRRTAQPASEGEYVARAFDGAVRSMGLSNESIARRLRVSEKIVRDYRTGVRRIPSDVWPRVGRTVAEAFLVALLARVRGEAA